VARRLDGGRILIVLGALVLLVSLFLDWYEASGFDGSAATAWTTFEIVDLLLALLALGAILGVALPAVPGAGAPALPAWVVPAAGPVAFVLVALSLIDLPPAAQGADIDTGAWIAFASAAVMAVGSLLAVARISLVISVREREGASAADERDEPDDAPPDEAVVDESDVDEDDTQTMRVD
jgi:hypothetical protein